VLQRDLDPCDLHKDWSRWALHTNFCDRHTNFCDIILISKQCYSDPRDLHKDWSCWALHTNFCDRHTNFCDIILISKRCYSDPRDLHKDWSCWALHTNFCDIIVVHDQPISLLIRGLRGLPARPDWPTDYSVDKPGNETSA